MNTPLAKEREKTDAGTSRLVKVAAMLLLPLLVAAVAACDSGPSVGTPTASGPVGTATATPTSTNSRAPYDGIPEGKPKYTTANQPAIPEALDTKPKGELPSYVVSLQSSSRDKITAQYKGAVDHFDSYSHIPCYCGCAMYETPHTSLARCFVTEMKESGEATFTDHSLTCDKCQGIAEMTLAGLAKSQPLADIRADVFKKYGYTNTWTDTPAP